jgi:ribosomal protein S18 acetylase RimI-like enzyme
MKEIREAGSGYFVYQDHSLIGIGIAQGCWIHAIIALQKGAGEEVLLTLSQALTEREVMVELIDSNLPAKRLYERLGFAFYEQVETWYKIFPMSRKNT